MPTFQKVAATHCRVGESLIWEAETSSLYWSDIHAAKIYRLETTGRRLNQWTLPARVGSFGLCDDGRMVVALTSGLHMFDPRNGELTFIVDPEPDRLGERDKNRLNDGKVGPDGAFWVGSMHEDGVSAALYRLVGTNVERKVSALGTSNGLAFSADGRTMFLSDSRQCWIDRFSLDPLTGELSDRRRIATPNEAEGRPDGAAADVEGCYWSAGVSAGVLNRFSAKGELLETIPVPPKHPTMPCFGGGDMRTLYFTSLRKPEGATDDCGDVFSFRVDVAGVPVGRFRTKA